MARNVRGEVVWSESVWVFFSRSGGIAGGSSYLETTKIVLFRLSCRHAAKSAKIPGSKLLPITIDIKTLLSRTWNGLLWVKYSSFWGNVKLNQLFSA